MLLLYWPQGQYSKNTKFKKNVGGSWPPPAPIVAPPLATYGAQVGAYYAKEHVSD